MLDYRYETWLSQYPSLIRDLDTTYGGPNYNKKAYIKGRGALLSIMTYLAVHKQSSCEDIAKDKLRKPVSKRELKPITDDLRKFVNNNLIPRRIVEEDGFKKVYNHNVKTYSLTPFGILYSIHLLPKDEENRVANNLDKEYQNTIPKVFGKFTFFEKALGKNFIDIIGIQELADAGQAIADMAPAGILSAFVHESGGAYYGDPLFLLGRWTNQISLVIYCNILNHLDWESEFEHMRTGEDYQIIRRRKISNFWKEMDNRDPEIKKWFSSFVKEASYVYKERVKALSRAKDWLH